MDNATITVLKKLLLRDIAYLCHRADRLWNAPIVRTLRALRESNAKAVFFGGTLRSLLVSRLSDGCLGRPRDLDIVVSDTTLESLRNQFHSSVERVTRFGGLHLRQDNWHFDIWPLPLTNAFVEDSTPQPTFNDLPSTTFFNLEAIAVEVWPSRGMARIAFSGDNQFFQGIINRTLELNRESNPFPSLCVVRALVLASTIGLSIGPKLSQYISEHFRELTRHEIRSIQKKHYGELRICPEVMKDWITHIRKQREEGCIFNIDLPFSSQHTFWPEDKWPKLQFWRRVINGQSTN